MPRSQRRVDADSPYQDGHIFVPVTTNDITTGAGATSVATYNGIATGKATRLATAATAYTATIALGSLLARYGLMDDTQNAFGAGGVGGFPFGAQGLEVARVSTLATANAGPSLNTAISLTVRNSAGFTVGSPVQIDSGASAEFSVVTAVADATHVTVAGLTKAHTANFSVTQNPFSTPAGVTGAPPFSGVTQLTPVTAPRPKGILFRSITPVYSILTAAASLNTIGLISTTFVDQAATSTANLIAVAANGLQTATSSANQAYGTLIAVATAQQVFRTTRLTQFVIQWNLTTGAAADAALWGVWLDVTFNFN